MGEYLGERAVVLGGGMAGLLTARVLSERYRAVVLVERDTILGVTETRRGVPQGHHAHGLLARGQQILEAFFPGLQAELTADGIPSGDLSGRLRWYFNGKRLQQRDSGLLSVSATRPELEAHVRTRVAALANVELRERTVIQSLVATADHARVTGVRVSGDGAEPETILADLVVDATGRGSRSSLWLEELGYERPAEERIKIDLAYTTRQFELDTDPFGDDLAINPVASPANPRGGFFVKLQGNVALLSQTGLLGDHPPRDAEGFLEFAKTLDAPEVYRAVRTAKPITGITSFKVPASVRRRFDRLTRFPAGLLVIGDGVCAFNPVYGQGMTVAAMEADQLARHLDDGGVRPLRFFKEISPTIDVPWDISAGGDLAFPGVEGPRPLKVKMGNAYMAKLHSAATVDGRFTEAFFRSAGLVDPPAALMRPSLVVGVLRAARRAKAAERVAPVAPIGQNPPSSEDLAA
ncbi:NAD(P)/FAD-dependent oxidoreductase [Amycolatopsis australiensis]|uniref:2-polyprenyl-6-methoxyphenol hydroxylase n=1 Tax=Amycolatopsis australiensis TaxID=546364 RepID=A0A1K1RKX3_9PSEU|nr:FAD-dependent oxidoreductase [Amycolatopsis australiensis]SFW72443.1 2-polyprenyl-6-methoxyphenol hydroxylase [Amycolatopsis australiensis]